MTRRRILLAALICYNFMPIQFISKVTYQIYWIFFIITYTFSVDTINCHKAYLNMPCMESMVVSTVIISFGKCFHFNDKQNQNKKKKFISIRILPMLSASHMQILTNLNQIFHLLSFSLHFPPFNTQ